MGRKRDSGLVRLVVTIDRESMEWAGREIVV